MKRICILHLLGTNFHTYPLAVWFTSVISAFLAPRGRWQRPETSWSSPQVPLASGGQRPGCCCRSHGAQGGPLPASGPARVGRARVSSPLRGAVDSCLCGPLVHTCRNLSRQFTVINAARGGGRVPTALAARSPVPSDIGAAGGFPSASRLPVPGLDASLTRRILPSFVLWPNLELLSLGRFNPFTLVVVTDTLGLFTPPCVSTFLMRPANFLVFFFLLDPLFQKRQFSTAPSPPLARGGTYPAFSLLLAALTPPKPALTPTTRSVSATVLILSTDTNERSHTLDLALFTTYSSLQAQCR